MYWSSFHVAYKQGKPVRNSHARSGTRINNKKLLDIAQKRYHLISDITLNKAQ